MATIYSTTEKITKRKIVNGKVVEYEVTYPIRHAQLAMFPPEMSRREKREALRRMNKAIAKQRKLVEQARKEDLKAEV